MTPEQRARQDIDRLLEAAGWHVCDYKGANIHAARGGTGAINHMFSFLESGERAEKEDEEFNDHLGSQFKAPDPVREPPRLPIETFGFLNQNLTIEFGHPQAVADGVYVKYDVYPTKTEVTDADNSKVGAGYWLQVLDKPTRARRDCQLDDDFEYASVDLDRSMQTPDRISIVARSLYQSWQTDQLPQPQELNCAIANQVGPPA